MNKAKFEPIIRLHTTGDSQSHSYHHQSKLILSLNIFQINLHFNCM